MSFQGVYIFPSRPYNDVDSLLLEVESGPLVSEVILISLVFFRLVSSCDFDGFHFVLQSFDELLDSMELFIIFFVQENNIVARLFLE